jgi:hypothetical protein
MSSTSTWSFDYSESLIDWLNIVSFFASLFLCCFINLRINTTSKMSFFINSTASQKTNVILKKLDDWDEWIMIIKTMIKRDDVKRYVNLIKIASAKSIELDLFIFFTIKIDAINSTDLSIDEQRDFVILRKDYKNQMRRYKERIDVLKNLNIFILTSVDRFNLIYLRNQKTIHQKLSALKKRLASTNRIRRLEIVRKYKNLQRAFKHQQMNQWLLNWEKIYTKTKPLNLSDVQKDRCAYDFLNALRTMNLSFVSDKETILNHEVNQRKSSTSIKDILKEFRNHLRIARALITKRAIHKAFETLKEKSSNEKTTDQKESEKFSNRRIDLAYVTESICSKTVIIGSRKFARLNENRTKKSKSKSTIFSNRIRSFESQSNTLRKKSQNDLKKKRRSRKISTTNQDRLLRNSFIMK